MNPEKSAIGEITAKIGILRAATLVCYDQFGQPIFDDSELTIPLQEVLNSVFILDIPQIARVNDTDLKILINYRSETRSPEVYLEELIHWIHLNYEANDMRSLRLESFEGTLLFSNRVNHPFKFVDFDGTGKNYDQLVPNSLIIDPYEAINFIDTMLEFVARYQTLEIISGLDNLKDDYFRLLDECRSIDFLKHKTLGKNTDRNLSHDIGYALGVYYHLSEWTDKMKFNELIRSTPVQLLMHVRKFEKFINTTFIPTLKNFE